MRQADGEDQALSKLQKADTGKKQLLSPVRRKVRGGIKRESLIAKRAEAKSSAGRVRCNSQPFKD